VSAVETWYRGFHLVVHPMTVDGRMVNAMRVDGDLIATRPGKPWGAMTQLRKAVDALLAEEVAQPAKV
jgi:carbamoylphosphate synthase small subunit